MMILAWRSNTLKDYTKDTIERITKVSNNTENAVEYAINRTPVTDKYPKGYNLEIDSVIASTLINLYSKLKGKFKQPNP